MIDADDARAFVNRAQSDPVWWVKHVLGNDLWSKQREIIESVRDNKRTVVRSCHGIGKSFTAARVALWWLYSHPYAIVATTAPTFRQVEKILWQEMRGAHSKSKVALGGKPLNTEIKLDDGWFAMGFATDDPNAVQGLHSPHLLLILDEASGIPPKIWEAAEGVLTSAHCRLLAIGNPTEPAGPLADEFKSPGASKYSVSCFDSPNFTEYGITLDDVVSGAWRDKAKDTPYPWLITPEWVADKVTRWGTSSPAFKSRCLGEFPDLGDNTLIPMSWIERAQARWSEACKSEATLAAGTVLSVDVARFGSDETVIGKRTGDTFRAHKTLRGADTMAVSGAVIDALRVTGASRAHIDSVGVGAGVYDRLVELKIPVASMGAGEAALDKERFSNARAEWFWTLRERFERDEIAIDDTDDNLFGQLCNLRYKINSRGQILIESKDEMRKRGLPSPDRADAMAMAFAESLGTRAATRYTGLLSLGVR